MKSWRTLAVLLLCLALAGTVACSPFGGGNKEETSQQLVEVTRGDIMLSVTADGNLSLPWHRKLTFGTSGKVAEVNVEEGDRVTEGQVLASLDTISLEQVVNTAEYAVKTTELAIKIAEIDLELATKNFELATDNFRRITYPYTYYTFVFSVPEAVAAMGDAQRQIKEAREALEIGLSSDQYWEVRRQLKQAQDNLIEAKSMLDRGKGTDVFETGIVPIKDFWTLRATQIQMEEAQLQVEKAQLALDKAKNDLDKANDDLDKANDDLEKAVILAPFDGIIAAVNVKQGDKLSSVDYATKTIVELIDPTTMELSAEMDEIDIAEVKLGQRAIIEVDALPTLQLEGRVISISLLPEVQAGIVVYKVKIGFDVPAGSRLRAGMSATADIVIDEQSNVLLVPDRAIKLDSQGNPMVKVMVNEEIEERLVVVGISDGFQTEIVDGLNEGDVVIVETKAKPTEPGFLF